MEYYSALKQKEICHVLTTWMNPEDTILSAISQSHTEGQILQEVSKVVRLKEVESKMVVARVWEDRNRELRFNRYRVSVSVMRVGKVLEICCKAMCI